MSKRTLVLAALGLALLAPGARADSVALSSDTLVAKAGVPAAISGMVTLDTPRPVVNTLVVNGGGAIPVNPSWITVSSPPGPFYPPVQIPFTATVMLPVGTRDGRFAFGVSAEVDGVLAGWADFTVEVGGGVHEAVLEPPKFISSWDGNRFLGSLRLTGFVPVAGELRVGIRHRGAAKRILIHVETVPTGRFSRAIRLQRYFKPGDYFVTQSFRGSSAATVNLAKSFWVALAPPPEGYVVRVGISGSVLGDRSSVFPRGTKALYASFRFTYLPRGGVITTTWYQPSGSPTRWVAKRRARLVRAFVRSATALAPGRWRCVLRVGAVPIAQSTVSIR
jgi:hypothetical protein